MKKKSVVIVGGGTGTHTVLRGLKQYTDRIDLTAIVSMADSGGSTGRFHLYPACLHRGRLSVH